MTSYALYGLTIESNRPILGLPPARGSREIVTIDFAGALEPDVDAPPFSSDGFETLWHLTDDVWLLRYDPAVDGYRWTLRYDGGARITVRWASDFLLDDIPAVLQGPGIAATLHLRAVPLLHACAVAIDGGAILLIGDPGAGKSTTAAALLASGCALVSDDIAALSIESDRVLVHAGYPRMRLYADSARAAGWDPAGLPRVFVTPLLGDKRYVALEGDAFCAEPLAIRAIYVLRPRRAGGGDPVIAPIARTDAWPLLARNVYAARFLDARRRVQMVRDCAAVAARVPLRSIEAGDNLAALPRLVAALTADALLPLDRAGGL